MKISVLLLTFFGLWIFGDCSLTQPPSTSLYDMLMEERRARQSLKSYIDQMRAYVGLLAKSIAQCQNGMKTLGNQYQSKFSQIENNMNTVVTNTINLETAYKIVQPQIISLENRTDGLEKEYSSIVDQVHELNVSTQDNLSLLQRSNITNNILNQTMHFQKNDISSIVRLFLSRTTTSTSEFINNYPRYMAFFNSSVRKESVAFQATLSETFDRREERHLNFSVTIDVGGAYKPETGQFRIAIPGYYHLHYTGGYKARDDHDSNRVGLFCLRKNGQCFQTEKEGTFIKLKIGDVFGLSYTPHWRGKRSGRRDETEVTLWGTFYGYLI